jgi:hypothetical protein
VHADRAPPHPQRLLERPSPRVKLCYCRENLLGGRVVKGREGWLALSAVAAAVGAWSQTGGAIQPPAQALPSPEAAAPASPGAAATASPGPAQSGPAYRNFAFTHLVAKLPENQVYETYRMGGLCLGNYTKAWHGGQAEEHIAPATKQAVRDELRAAGLKLEGDSDNIFEKTDAETSETELGAIIVDASFNYCLRYSPYNTSNTSITGDGAMSIDWQLYDKLTKTVLATIHTDGDYQVKTLTAGNSSLLFTGAFRENVKKLAASQTFRTALLTPETHDLAATSPTRQEPIALIGARAAPARPVSDAVGAVVLIFAGQAEGSGFLVSSDGLLLTDQHVVGDARYVKVRWPDGIEGLGEVIRSNKVRDVALVKTDPRGRKPLALRREPLQPGDGVFAIGAPTGDRYQSTMTHGIVSAYRTFEGLSFIQSDVNVNHGSSGGPLLDDKGEAVALTESGAQIAGAPLGLNLFTPVSDALDFLSADPR